MQAIHQAMATTIAACGDVNRQVVSSVNPYLSSQHRIVQEWTQKLSDHFIPRTRAYHEIWLDGEKITDDPEEEPIYGDTYLPRKFKIENGRASGRKESVSTLRNRWSPYQ